MSPAAKVRASYGLTVLFVAGVLLWMGELVLHFEGEAVWGSAEWLPLLAVSLLLGFSGVRIAAAVFCQWRLTRKGWRFLLAYEDREASMALYSRYREWNTGITVVRDKAFVALSLGLWRPRIVVSTGVLEQFSPDEVQAILLHEWHHCRKRDNLWLFLLSLLADAFRYLPVIKPVLVYVKTWQELFADRFAIRRMGSPFHVGAVLLKLAGKGSSFASGAALHFAGTALEYRMLQVIEPEQEVKVPLRLRRPFLVTCCFLLLLLIGGSS